MTNEELKKKIVEVVLNSEITGIQIRAITGGYSMSNNIAEALIAAGIGDVAKAEYRAEVAERALDKACKLLKLDCSTMFNKYGCPDERIDLSCTVCRKQWLIEKVEKELAEENK